MIYRKSHLISKTAAAALMLLVVVATYLIYQQGLLGSFIFDDAPNILENNAIGIQNLQFDTLVHAAFSSTSGPLLRPISMLSFALNAYFTGFSAYDFKLTNLLIHLINGFAVFFLSGALLNAYRSRYEQGLPESHIFFISLATSTAWLLHPLGLTSVLYVVQRMTSLSALFCFWGLFFYVSGRNRQIEGRGGIGRILISILLCTPLATLSKETGALMPLLMLVIEVSFFHFQTVGTTSKRLLYLFFVAAVGLPALGLLAYLVTHPSWLPLSYVGRSFTLQERLMTEPRIIWFYLSEILIPNLKQFGLFHDDIAISRDFISPITTLPAILGISGLLATAWLVRNRLPILTFGIGFFLAGHALESTIFPLEITFEHRNYLPMFGILFAALFYLMYPLRYTSNLRLRQIAAVLFIAILAYDTHTRANAWSSSFEQAKDEVEHHPNSARDNGNMAREFAKIVTPDQAFNDVNYAYAQDYFGRATAADRNYTIGLVSELLLSAERKKPVDPKWIPELQNRLQTAYLDNDIGNALSSLVMCQFKEVCHFQKDELQGLLQAALANPSVAGGKRALVLAALSLYQIDISKDYPAAIDTMHQTIELNPNEPQYRLTLAKVLIVLGHFGEARTELANLKKIDTLHAYSSQIAGAEKRLTDDEADLKK